MNSACHAVSAIVTAQPVFLARSYDELRAALNARRQQLGLTMEVLDEISGLQPGYSGKIFGGRRVKNMGPLSATVLLGALGVQLAIIPCSANAASQTIFEGTLSAYLEIRKKLGRKGGQIANARRSYEERRAIGRKGALARWGRDDA